MMPIHWDLGDSISPEYHPLGKDLFAIDLYFCLFEWLLLTIECAKTCRNVCKRL